jgi:hypothetical protein
MEDVELSPNFNNNTEKAKMLLNLMKNEKEFEKDEDEINKVLDKLEEKRCWVEKKMGIIEKWLDSLEI